MGNRRTYEQLIDGEPETFVIGQSAYEACCGCGLTHRVIYSVIESEDGTIRKVVVRRWQDGRRTGQTRRWMREKLEGIFGQMKLQ